MPPASFFRTSNLRHAESSRHYFTKARDDFSILVHSHLSWDNVWQRPQQFLSRLAVNHPVLFVETSVLESLKTAEYQFGKAAGAQNVTQLKILFPSDVWQDGDYVDRERRRLVKAALLEKPLRRFQSPVQWFYDPMAVTAFAGQMNEKLIVYDCMDQLSQFRDAPRELAARERSLLKMADVVFCGGKKLHQEKSVFNDNCHFYGCGVDVEHFAKARDKETPIPEDIAPLPRPILGYYGVIDERLDYALLLQLARKTTGSVVMLGPLAKVSERDLPRHKNLHWLGRRSYVELPAYAKGFDVCLMPFALNEATEFINPTKALEYLSAGRPVVSTAVADVRTLFSSTVHIASGPGEFAELCFLEAANPTWRMKTRGLRLAENNTWDKIVGKIKNHLIEALQHQKEASGDFATEIQGVPAL